MSPEPDCHYAVGLWREEHVRICKQTIYSPIHADKSGRLLENTRHKGKYSRHREPGAREVKAANIKGRVSIHDRPPEADGTRFGDWEMDLIIGKNGYGAILALMGRSTTTQSSASSRTARRLRRWPRPWRRCCAPTACRAF